MTKILFLDCDGVVNGHKDWVLQRGEINPVNPGSMALLREVVDTTGCKIVFSSVWRADNSEHGWRKVARQLTNPRDNVYMENPTTIWPAVTGFRGDDIEHWFSVTEKFCGDVIEKYAIIDDDSDFHSYQLPHFVKTENSVGMRQEHADKLKDLLT